MGWGTLASLISAGVGAWGVSESSKARKEAEPDPISPEAIEAGTEYPSSKKKKKRQPGLAQRQDDLGPLKLSKSGFLGSGAESQERATAMFG